MACFETAPMTEVNATSSSAKWVVMLRNFTFPVIWWAFMWHSFQFHGILGHPGASGNGAALGSVLTIFVGIKNFHYFSGVNMQPSSGLTLCQYTCVQSLWKRRTAKNKTFSSKYAYRFSACSGHKGRQRIIFSSRQKSGRENNVERKITWSKSRYFRYFLPWHGICVLHTFAGKLPLFLSKICVSKMLTELLAHWMGHHIAFGKALAGNAKLHFLLSKSTTWINITNHHC